MDDRIEIGAWASVGDSEGELGSYLNCGELGFETYAPGDVLLGMIADEDEIIRTFYAYRESRSNGGAAEFLGSPTSTYSATFCWSVRSISRLSVNQHSCRHDQITATSTVGEEPDLEPEPPPQPDRTQLATFVGVCSSTPRQVTVSLCDLPVITTQPFRIATVKLNGYSPA